MAFFGIGGIKIQKTKSRRNRKDRERSSKEEKTKLWPFFGIGGTKIQKTKSRRNRKDRERSSRTSRISETARFIDKYTKIWDFFSFWSLRGSCVFVSLYFYPSEKVTKNVKMRSKNLVLNVFFGSLWRSNENCAKLAIR